MFEKSDTIAAVATGLTNSGVGIIRISGPEAVAVGDRLFRSKKGVKLKEVSSHTIHYGHVYDGEEMVDEVLTSVMLAPHTFTGEDTVEINCHGGVMIMEKIVMLAVKCGARPAEPGEFSKRAFLNGKMDLTKAEAVMEMIHASNEYALRSSVNQLKGVVAEKIKSMRERIIYEIAFIESALDDPEHISIDGYSEKLGDIVDGLIKEMETLLKTSKNGKLVKEGIKTVIVGRPNAGKSSFLNRLVGEERAIVTDIAGTTRDVLEETILLDGIQLNLVDTAGIRKTEDVVEKIGVERAKQYAEKADLLIHIIDSSVELDTDDEEILSMIGDKKAVILLNKSDLTSVVTKEDIAEKTSMPVIDISAKENTGIDEFIGTIKNWFLSGEIDYNHEVIITNVRHEHLLEEALESLRMVMESVKAELPEDFYSIDLMNAYTSLGLIIGEEIEDDLVDEIFSKFCMGK